MVTLTVLMLLYFLPTVIASQRGHSLGGILMMNLFFGWTGIGWFALMLWALLSPPPFYYAVRPVYYQPYGGWRRY
ncbi:hypothetical protein HDF16_000965 [Granulicella aggregans]|uniref:Superinfection immunity protein n=1 Tax=Granulicella aggregans TaxID=474949 RepID=A0A7W8E2E9_9BACT|nr:superinfection immunity protein [Granulicella aggregans]MBB5056296.1 hypothetical protein [Granulicella aggregans]